MKTRYSTSILATALALAIGLGGTAFAMGPDGRCGPPGDRMEMRMNYGMKEMARLHDDLKLDAKQEAAWQEADSATRGNIGGMREQMRKQREEGLAALNQPGADLRAIAKRMDEFRDAGRKQHEANRDRWLAVYDLLNAEQKEKARLFFKSKLERMDGFGKGRPGRG
ncbi:MAG: periplasmic heavy metal sensor [Betaproteobacteria bacterium]|nr:periplasmic heavy metal sensor [Betaproteobacteria bacterium]